jgi:hypothetical protein
LSFAVIFFAVIMLSCSTEENSNSNETIFSSMNEMILVKSSTKRVTSKFADLGVSKINIKKDDSFLSRIGNESTEVTFEDVKPFYIDKNLIHFSDYTFVISGDKFILNENNSFYLSVENGNLYLNTPNKKLNVMLDNNYSFEKESSLLILAFNELTSTESRLPGGSGSGGGYPKPCGFWDKYEVVSLGFTGYESQMNNYNATHGSGALGAGCRSMGPTTTSCMYDNHVCATTKSFCCD